VSPAIIVDLKSGWGQTGKANFMIRRIALLCSITMLLGCAETPTAPKPAPKSEALPSSKAKPSPRPVARWDHRPEAARWTDKTLTALSSHGAPLVNMVPSDVATYCPAYAENGPGERKAFWVGLLSALAKHESTWRPDVSGGDGRPTCPALCGSWRSLCHVMALFLQDVVALRPIGGHLLKRQNEAKWLNGPEHNPIVRGDQVIRNARFMS
jgi:hypothetical protein